MNMIFKAFAKKLFGVKCEKLKRTVFLCLVVFWGLYIADWKIKIAPSVLYLMASAFTGGVMWQALTSKDNAASMKNLFMLPFDRRKFVFSYVAALGAYTFFTKTVMLLAVVWAVAAWNPVEILASILCATNAVLMAAVMYVFRKYWYSCHFVLPTPSWHSCFCKMPTLIPFTRKRADSATLGKSMYAIPFGGTFSGI